MFRRSLSPYVLMTPAVLDDDELRPPSVTAKDTQKQQQESAEAVVSEIVEGNEEALPVVPPSPRGSATTAQLAPTAGPGVRVVAELLRAPTVEARNSQLVMSLGVFLLSVSLGASALCFHDEIFDATGIESGLLLGSAGSLSMCAVVIGAYLRSKWYRRHIHILLMNLALCELCLAISFLLEPAWNRLGAGVGSEYSCRWLSTAREYFIMCSSAWTTCTALDLYYLMTNPFTSPRLNRHKYQGIAHVTAFASAVVMAVSNSFGSPVAVGGFCWVGGDTQARSDHISFKRPSGSTTGIWVFIVAPAAISMIANLNSRSNSVEGDKNRRNVCPNRAGAPHEPNVVLKDMDLTMKLRFGKVAGRKLLAQLMRDSDFLCARGVMDYSLLLGIIEVSYLVNRHNILTRDGSVFLPPDSFTGKPTTPRRRSGTDGEQYGDNEVTGSTERVKQSTQCLRAAEVVIGPGFYYIGVIDMLQTWNLSKRFERFVKTVIFRKDPDGISAMPPKPYRDRFHRKLREIIHLGHNSSIVPPAPATIEDDGRRNEGIDGMCAENFPNDLEDDEYNRMTRIRPRGVALPPADYTVANTGAGQPLKTARNSSGEIPMTPSAQGHVLGSSL
ncbi:Phosphatidylinositol-4-phosphate-5-kinase (PIPK-D6/GPCR-PIPK) [Phytophthora cinnamomi]|uniref:Phosphatidylinositol-4-phosphate-5-kinase (PIPK-D6/GPCR-PIPK) n=1 Tax=Phytophthora cinnamomi TaxID=4785 RepID=UPI00355AA8C7|nr:Phosphatidylinositol-4-phosphate-5-kinase (PIPK-D6/GPCR-PIPK) [Phytophthora cinnamomi]